MTRDNPATVPPRPEYDKKRDPLNIVGDHDRAVDLRDVPPRSATPEPDPICECGQGCVMPHMHRHAEARSVPPSEPPDPAPVGPRTEAFDTRPCEVACCDQRQVRHVHEGTHEDHVGDGRWCIDCDVVIGQPGENVSAEAARPAEPLDVETLHQYLHDEGVWPDDDHAWHLRVCEVAARLRDKEEKE